MPADLLASVAVDMHRVQKRHKPSARPGSSCVLGAFPHHVAGCQQKTDSNYDDPHYRFSPPLRATRTLGNLQLQHLERNVAGVSTANGVKNHKETRSAAVCGRLLNLQPSCTNERGDEVTNIQPGLNNESRRQPTFAVLAQP